jgi:ribosome-associated protein
MGDKQATNLIVLDMRRVSVITEYFVIGTADSPRQMRAVANALKEAAREEGAERVTITDGEPSSGWILIDFGDVMAHVCDPERRAFYQLEALWHEAPLVARMA